MEQKYYSCQYCKKDFVPKRRKIQKFCSASCRVSFHRLHNVEVAIKSTKVQIKDNKHETSKTKIEQVSMSGVANATIGVGLAEIAKNLLTSEQNKPATKGDIAKLAAKLKRYHPIKNLPPKSINEFPYFDIIRGIVVYLKMGI